MGNGGVTSKSMGGKGKVLENYAEKIKSKLGGDTSMKSNRGKENQQKLFEAQQSNQNRKGHFNKIKIKIETDRQNKKW